MRIVFATTQSLAGSTLIGRVEPLASKLSANHNVDILMLGDTSKAPKIERVSFHSIGSEPFTRTSNGKKRLKGFALILNMLSMASRTATKLLVLKPDIVVIEKTLPSNVLGVWLWSLMPSAKKARIILDVDDFELTANKLSSLIQRASIHWAERTAVKLATAIITASPFLSDHFKQLVQQKKPVHLIPTGLSESRDIVSQENNPPVISYIGSVSISSGHRVDLLPEILQGVRTIIPNTKLLIAGSGDDVENLKIKFAELGLSDAVEWRGRFSKDDVPEIVKSTTVIIDPIDDSIAQRAKSSYRVALAGSVGLPVVTSNIGVRPMLLPDELHPHFFAAPSNVNEYVAKVVCWLQNPITSEQKIMLKKHSEEYNWDNLATTYECVILA